MRKLLIFIFCLGLASCAGTRTLDGETTKNWVKIVSSRTDKSGNIKDVCFVFDLSFYPGTVYDRLKNNPNTCLEECCWYSENKVVDFYFNDGFIKDLQEQGVSRRYYPDHIEIKMTYSQFLNRLSAKASSPEGISKDGIVRLDYDEVRSPEIINEDSLYQIEPRVYPETSSDKKKEAVSYKTISMSGLNRDELLARAQGERDAYYAKAVEERYESPEKEYVEESIAFRNQVSPFDYPEDREEKWLSKKTLAEEEELKWARFKQNRYTDEEKALFLAQREAKETEANAKKAAKQAKNDAKNAAKQAEIDAKSAGKKAKADAQKAADDARSNAKNAKTKVKGILNDDDVMYDVQIPNYEKSKLVYVEPIMPEKVDKDTLTQKLRYERKEAVKLLKRFYGDEIDAYLRALDKAKREDGQILFTNNKIWQASKIGTTIYKVDCNVNGKIILLGAKSGSEMTDYPFSCGTYIVDLDEKTVEAKDELAKKIAKKKY